MVHNIQHVYLASRNEYKPPLATFPHVCVYHAFVNFFFYVCLCHKWINVITLCAKYKLDTETKGSTVFRNPRALGCSDPSAAIEGATKGPRVSK